MAELRELSVMLSLCCVVSKERRGQLLMDTRVAATR